MISIANSDAEIMGCFDVMQELRPHLEKAGFLGQVRRMQADGFELMYKQLEDTVVAVAGFRIAENLFMGRHLYVDDLVTAASARSSGHGAELVAALRARAEAEQCSYLHLDSGTHRAQAHKFYFAQGFEIASYHFSQKLV